MKISSTLKLWIAACRPRTLWAAIGPVLIGTAMAYADGGGHLVSGLLALYCALMFQVGSNLANDYFDHLQGTDTHRRIGPIRATQSGLVTPAQTRMFFIAVFMSTLPAGLYLLLRGGWPLLAIGLFSIAAAILYTARPVAFGYHGWGEFFVLLCFGPVAVAGTYYVQTLRLTPAVLIAGLAPGLLAAAILVVNNLRDVETDRESGKRTLAVRGGETFSRWEYTAAIGSACAIPAILHLLSPRHPYALLAAAVLIPALPGILAIHQLRRCDAQYGPRMNQLLARTSRLLLLYSLLFSLGYLR